MAETQSKVFFEQIGGFSNFQDQILAAYAEMPIGVCGCAHRSLIPKPCRGTSPTVHFSQIPCFYAIYMLVLCSSTFSHELLSFSASGKLQGPFPEVLCR